MIKQKKEIGIIGAGIAGLTAGRELQRAGYSVSIYEARPVSGGRIQSLNFGSYHIECGPEFIHGHLQETMALLKQYQIRYIPVNGKMYTLRNGSLAEEYEMAEGWDQLLDKMRLITTDVNFGEFLLTHFPGRQYELLRKSAIGFAEGFDLADISKASTKALFEEWQYEEMEQFRIPAGYSVLVDAMEKDFKELGGKIWLNHAVSEIDWQNERSLVTTINGSVHMMDQVIVTIPASLLNNQSKESITFSPAIPEKINAFSKIGFGSVVKIVMIWNTAFWNEITPEALFIFSDGFFPTWWTQHPLNIPILTGWMGNTTKESYSFETEDFYIDKALTDLSSIFSMPVGMLKEQLLQTEVFDWRNIPWSHGAYSYSPVNYKEVNAVCRLPVEDKIYFAGEAVCEGPFPGTVEAAVISGLNVARQIITNA